MNEKLLGCPHCGGRPIVRAIDRSNSRVHKVECQNSCQPETDREEAINNWNTRFNEAIR